MTETAQEFQPQDDADWFTQDGSDGWYIQRQQNRWYSLDETRSHPFPGTYPSVITDGAEWGGWRVSAAEYNRVPWTIEYQARLIAEAPQLLSFCRRLADLSRTGDSLTRAELDALHQILDTIGDAPVQKDWDKPSATD